MNPSINLSRDGKLIQIFIPARLGRHSGRKTILSPTGQPVNPDRNTKADITLINALLRAHRWNRWLAKTTPLMEFIALFNELSDWINGVMPDLTTVVGYQMNFPQKVEHLRP